MISIKLIFMMKVIRGNSMVRLEDWKQKDQTAWITL